MINLRENDQVIIFDDENGKHIMRYHFDSVMVSDFKSTIHLYHRSNLVGAINCVSCTVNGLPPLEWAEKQPQQVYKLS